MPPTAAPTLTCQVRADDAVITRRVGSGCPAGRTARQDVEYEADRPMTGARVLK